MSQTGIGEGADPDNIAALCSDDVECEIPGDDGAWPGIDGRRDVRRLPTSFVACGV